MFWSAVVTALLTAVAGVFVWLIPEQSGELAAAFGAGLATTCLIISPETPGRFVAAAIGILIPLYWQVLKAGLRLVNWDEPVIESAKAFGVASHDIEICLLIVAVVVALIGLWGKPRYTR
ncbi:hypothetical protein DZF98_00035 [Clavibacter californiensis]|uniref:Uncharacterized protein n=2 Tax=Clavibacter californiensis TaxID=1401995 RepID=A0ABX9NDZ0_9MICO|nr:hypothetical protein DZF98_00035 [Clavibacter californiensis]